MPSTLAPDSQPPENATSSSDSSHGSNGHQSGTSLLASNGEQPENITSPSEGSDESGGHQAATITLAMNGQPLEIATSLSENSGGSDGYQAGTSTLALNDQPPKNATSPSEGSDGSNGHRPGTSTLASNSQPPENPTSPTESSHGMDGHQAGATESIRGQDTTPTPNKSPKLSEQIQSVQVFSLVRALHDYKPMGPGELEFQLGDVIEHLGAFDAFDVTDWSRGSIYIGAHKGRMGIYPKKYVSAIDPTDLVWHDRLTAGFQDTKHAGPSISAKASERPLKIVRHEKHKAAPDSDDLPAERGRICIEYIRGRCSKGDACRFSHGIALAESKICQEFTIGGCTNHACTSLHIPELQLANGMRNKSPPPNASKFKSVPRPLASSEPVEFGSIVRQDSQIQPALLPPANNSAAKRSGAVGDILKKNRNYGPATRSYLPSQSVIPAQRCENGQRTPPLPTKPTQEASSATDEVANIETLCRQLRSQLFDAGKAELFYTLTRSQDSTQPKTSVLSIAALQHMALHQLQYDISCYVGLMYRTSTFYMDLQGFPPLTELMSKYCDAIRNLDYMKQCALRGYDEDPFLMKSSRALERSILETTKLIPDHVLPAGQLPLAKDSDNPQLRGMGRNEANRVAYQKNRLLRFAMSGLGALLLVVPMLIMANVPGKVPSLITTCIALLVFSVLITLLTELGPHEILATTAAYAAVLVVFVGTSLAPQYTTISVQ